MRLIDVEELFNKAVNLEAVAFEQTKKYEPLDNPREWRIWSAILTERTAFKYDLMDAPTVDAVEVVRCKDCKWGREVCGNIECSVERNLPPEYHGYDWYCPNGERREDERK